MLNENLYPFNQRLAEALGVSHTWVANVLAVVDLPPPVIECLRSPLEIQPKHARAIPAAYELDCKACCTGRRGSASSKRSRAPMLL